MGGISHSFDPLTDDSPHPIVFAPHGTDGSSTHAVCKLGNWLIDASRPYALPFGTEDEKRRSLDVCVRSNESDVHIAYDGIVQIDGMLPGVRIIPPQKMLDKRQATNGDIV